MAEIPTEITIDDFDKKVCDCLQTITGLMTVNERNPGPRVAESYISYLALDADGQQYPDFEYEGDPTEVIIDTPVMTTRIKVTGKSAFAVLTALCMSLRSSARNDDLYKYDLIGLSDTGNIQNITVPEPDFSRILEQAVVRVSFYCMVKVRFAVDYFTQARIQIAGNQDIDMIVDGSSAIEERNEQS